MTFFVDRPLLLKGWMTMKKESKKEAAAPAAEPKNPVLMVPCGKTKLIVSLHFSTGNAGTVDDKLHKLVEEQVKNGGFQSE